MVEQQQEEINFKKIGDNLLIITSHPLGKGACGNVYKGYFYQDHKIDFSRPLAIKESELGNFNFGNERRLQIMKDSLKEVEVMQQFNDPNIVQYIGAKKTQNHLYLVMELCNKGNLKTFLREKNGMTESEALYYFGQIIDAFRYLIWEKNYMMHRDIKPENILVHQTKHNTILKLTDFGTAKQVSQTSMRTIIGTPLFQSPSMMIGEGDTSVDIWSLGITLYFMLYYDPKIHKDYEERNLPWFTTKPVGMKDLIMKGLKFPNNTDTKIVSKEVKDLISRMLVPDPNQRIKWDELFRHPLLLSKMYSSNGRHLLYESIVQYPKSVDFVTNIEDDFQEETLCQKDLPKQEENELLIQRRQQYCNQILHEISISKFMRETGEKFFIIEKGKKQGFFFKNMDEQKVISLIYSINKMAYMFIFGLLNNYKTKNKGYINSSEKEWAFNNVKDQIEEELKRQQKYFEEYYQQSQQVVKNDLLLQKIKIKGEPSKDREFNEYTVTQIIPEFYVYLGVIKDKLKMKNTLSMFDKNVLSIIDNLLMIYTFDITFSWGYQNKPVDFEKFKSEREQDYNQPIVFCRIMQALQKFKFI